MNRGATFSLVLVLGLAVVLQEQDAGAKPGPIPGIHTIRADDGLLRLADEAGFSWIVQLVEWREIEPVPGEFFWQYTDWLVRAAEYYGLELVLRLDHPPEWGILSDHVTPVDISRYATFVEQVATRYRGRVGAYIIWNEPNLAAEWGGQPPEPAAYAELLCAAYETVRAADPRAAVVSAGLAPTNHADASALDDRRFLQAMFAAGAGACLDILGAHPYGFAYPPEDPYGAHNGLNFARLADLRAVAVEHGYGDRPIWATELGWTTDAVHAEQHWLEVSEDAQSRYLMGAFEQARQDWPWLDRIAVWNLSRGLAADDERRGYSLLADDGTPKPAYESLSAWATEQSDRLLPEQKGYQAEAQTTEVLAPDVRVRLSDVDTFYPHWARPHCASAPCRHWTGQFYVREPGTGTWKLRMEIMQIEEPGNRMWINGNLLDPPAIPLRGWPDYASVWTVVEISVPADILQSGTNTLEAWSSPRLPVYQDGRARFESLQIRHVRLTTDS